MIDIVRFSRAGVCRGAPLAGNSAEKTCPFHGCERFFLKDRNLTAEMLSE
jgi:hypothetical protein